MRNILLENRNLENDTRMDFIDAPHSIRMSLKLNNRPRKSILKKQSELSSEEICTELIKTGQTVSENVVGGEEQENVLRLNVLIDKGENPVSFEFEIQESTGGEDGQAFKVLERKKLIEKVLKLERYFTSEGGLK